MKQGFIIAGTNSGCGKTTVTIGLMALLKSLGKNIAPFKTGPDYIDPLFHRQVLQMPSYNLDSFLLSSSAIKYLYNKHTQNKDISIVEGVMGMYDGMGNHAIGSTYELSQILNLPVILVVGCRGLYQSVAAIVKGFANFKQATNVKGVILNHVSSADHFAFLKSIIERECNVSCVGYVPTNKQFSLESRHLGLIQAEEVSELDSKVNKLQETLSTTIDLEKLLAITQVESNEEEVKYALPAIDLTTLNIGVAYDKAFRFYYKDNLELLEELGATLQYFSPINDASLPEDINCLYIGGGYPEVFAHKLATNVSLRMQIKEAVENGMPCYAECGGLMYLTESIIDIKGEEYSMCGVFNSTIQMTKRLQRFGYAIAEYDGVTTKCHEFHRSQIIENESASNYKLTYQLHKPEKPMAWQCGLHANHCLAGYAHVHFYSDVDFFKKIVSLWKKAIM